MIGTKYLRPFEIILSMTDIMPYFVAPPVAIKLGLHDYRLGVQRPDIFAIYPTFDALILSLKKYNRRSVQKVIIDNAQRAYLRNKSEVEIPQNLIDAAIVQAQDIGLEQMLATRLLARQSMMVQPIDIQSMIPPLSDTNRLSQPPYPTMTALHDMQYVYQGIDVHTHPPSLIDVGMPSDKIPFNRAIERALRKLVEKGSMVVIPVDVFEQLCHDEGLPFHYSLAFFVAKDRTDIDDAGRLVIDFTASGINSKYSQTLYANRDGEYRDMTPAFIAQKIVNLRNKHPDQPIYLCLTDLTDCFKRIPMKPSAIPLTALKFFKDNIPMVALSLGANFGFNGSNSAQKSLTEGMNASVNAIDIEDIGEISGGAYVDDFIAPRVLDTVVQFFQTRKAVCESFEGLHAISATKSRWGEVMKALGFLFDTISMTISVSDTLLEKYLWVIFLLLPVNIQKGNSISLHDAQVASSYLHLIAVIVPSASAFSKGLARATRGVVQKGNSKVYMSDDAIIDLTFHREFAQRIFTDCRCLRMSMHILLLRNAYIDESSMACQLRQQAAADYTLYGDARGISDGKYGDCWMVAPKGNTIATQDHIIVDYGFGVFPALFECINDKQQKNLNIAILEMITALRGAYAFLHRLHIHRDMKKLMHIHILTDNHNAYHRLLKNKGTHPVVPFLLRQHSYLQQDMNVMFTYGTITSQDNRFTDAGSRNWNTPYGPQALQRINGMEMNPLLPPWLHDFQRVLHSLPTAVSQKKQKTNTQQH